MFTQGLAGLTGAVMREAAAPLASACAAMATSQEKLCERLASLADRWGDISGEMGAALQQQAAASMQELATRGSVRASTAACLPPQAREQPERSKSPPFQTGGAASRDECRQGVEPSWQGARRPPPEADPGDDTLMSHGGGGKGGARPDSIRPEAGRGAKDGGGRPRRGQRLRTPAALQQGGSGSSDEAPQAGAFGMPQGPESSGREPACTRRRVASVPLAQVESAVRTTQAEHGFAASEMPLLLHLRQSGFADEALAIAYDLGGREEVAARLGLHAAAESIATSRFAAWEVVEKAVRRAAKSLQVYEHRQLLARRDKAAAKPGARHASKRHAAHAVGGVVPATPLRMPNGKQLCAQGMEEVDKAIREVHGGYEAVAAKLDLEPPAPQVVIVRAPRSRKGQADSGPAGPIQLSSSELGGAPRRRVGKETLAPPPPCGEASHSSSRYQPLETCAISKISATSGWPSKSLGASWVRVRCLKRARCDGCRRSGSLRTMGCRTYLRLSTSGMGAFSRLRASSGSASRAPVPAPRGRALLARRYIAVGGAERSESQAHQVGRKLAPDAINPGTAVEGWRAGGGDRVAGGRERRSRIPVRSGPAAQTVSWLCNKRQTQG